MGNKKYGESGKHGSNAFRRHSSVSNFFLSPWIGSARKIASTQASPLRTPVTPPSAAAVTIAHYRHFHRPLPLLLPWLAATPAASGRWRHQLLPPPPSTAVYIYHHHRSHRPLPPSPPAAPAAALHCHQPLLMPPPLPAATTAASGLCHNK